MKKPETQYNFHSNPYFDTEENFEPMGFKSEGKPSYSYYMPTNNNVFLNTFQSFITNKLILCILICCLSETKSQPEPSFLQKYLSSDSLKEVVLFFFFLTDFLKFAIF